MSEYLSKKAVLEWLESEMSINKGHPDDIDIHWTLNRVSKKILSGAFDADDSKVHHLRAALEDIRYQVQQSDHPAGLGILATINQALSTTTEPTDAAKVERFECPCCGCEINAKERVGTEEWRHKYFGAEWPKAEGDGNDV